MTQDRFGFRHSLANSAALSAFERAVGAVAAHRPAAAVDLAEALAQQPGFIAAHALKGFAALIMGKDELIDGARLALASARNALLAAPNATSDERILVAALGQAVGGSFRDAASHLRQLLDDNPACFLAVKLDHALRFMLGDTAGMLDTTRRVLNDWTPERAGYGYLLGCHAFALEELGAFEEAEIAGRRAVQYAPDDAWGLHAVSHVFEMTGRTADGIRWLEGARPVWSRCNNFSFHMAWHLGLFFLETRDHEAALTVYDRDVWPAPTSDFRDIANAVSLLWRMEQDGVDVGERWQSLREVTARLRQDTTLTFASLHYLMALVATGAHAEALDLVRALENRAASGGDQSTVADQVGCKLARVLVGMSPSQAARQRLDRLALRLPLLGGSNAQRDVFMRTLAEVSAERGDQAACRRILDIRRRLKRDDTFVAAIETRLSTRSRAVRRYAGLHA